MRKTKDKVKEQDIPPEGALPPILGDDSIDTSHLPESNRQIRNVSSGVISLDEAFKKAFKKRPPKPNDN